MVRRGAARHLRRHAVRQRVRSQVWQLLADALAEEQSPAYAAFISPANNEQGFTIETYGDRRRYRAEDFDGLTLISHLAAWESEVPHDW